MLTQIASFQCARGTWSSFSEAHDQNVYQQLGLVFPEHADPMDCSSVMPITIMYEHGPNLHDKHDQFYGLRHIFRQFRGHTVTPRPEAYLGSAPLEEGETAHVQKGLGPQAFYWSRLQPKYAHAAECSSSLHD